MEDFQQMEETKDECCGSGACCTEEKEAGCGCECEAKPESGDSSEE